MKKSESIKEITLALVSASTELKNIPKNSENSFYNSSYADLPSIIELTKPVLVKNNLTLVQSAGGDGSNIIVQTLLMHTSGEWIETEVSLPSSNANRYDPQTVGSAITYGRRYGLAAILNIAADDDDDANSTIKTNVQNTQPVKKNNRIEFSEVKAKMSKMNLQELNEYKKELFENYSLSPAQQDSIIRMFVEREGQLQ